MAKGCAYFASRGKTLLWLFFLQPIVFGWRQNSSSSSFASWGKIKLHDFTLAGQDWIGLIVFKNFADQDWIGFNFSGSGLDSEWKISRSAHLWWSLLISAAKLHFNKIFSAEARIHQKSASVKNVSHQWSECCHVGCFNIRSDVFRYISDV